MTIINLVLQNHFFVFIWIILFFLLFTNHYVERYAKKCFILLFVLSLLYCIFGNMDYYFRMQDKLMAIRPLVSHLNYLVKPGLLLTVLLISERSAPRTRRLICAVPFSLFALLVVISYPSGLLVYFTEDNIFHHGPWFCLTWIILLLYLVAILISVCRKTRTEAILLVMSMCFIIFNILTELANRTYPGMESSIVSLSILTYYLYFQTKSYTEFRMETEKALTKAKVQTMISQIKPHFIYNSLACIAETCHDGAPEAEEAVLTFSSYLRSCFSSLEEDGLIPFSRELKTIENYLALENLQNDNKIHVVFDIRERNFMVPVLAIETLVENSVKHGLRKKRGGGTVTLRTFRENALIHLTIEDDGLGFEVDSISSDASHLGLKNAEFRLTEQCHARFSVQSAPQQGTRIDIVMDIMKA
ncbi:MAG: histidine kinase [Lachnospiraceae bacterium]|nr:histidine kinase [Lachnospiraceae bacterium]